MAPTFPDYDDLPEVQGMPKGCAWGVFDKDGRKDVYGCLNKITPDVVTAAATEVRDGVSISLNWPIGAIKTPGTYRKGLVHKVISFLDTPIGIHGYDDEVEFNTQCSSQWDSLCHFWHQHTQRGYNDVHPTIQDLTQSFGNEDTTKSLPTLNHWHERGGLVSRGVLIDYKAYAEAEGVKYSPFEAHKIRIADIEAIAKRQGVTFKQGDVIMIRSGYTEALSGASDDEQQKMIGTHRSVGVEDSIEAVKWFWNQHFSAVAGDTVGFEVIPATKDGIDASGGAADMLLHQNFLSLLGLNIGELWDLKALAEYCAKTGRYTFMFTSIPLNVAGAVGSPPNALAIF